MSSDFEDDASLSEGETLPDCNMDAEPVNPFLRLPTEIIQYIAYLLPSDGDIASFTSVCMSLAEKVLPSESSVWRGRFRDLYDISHGYSSTELKIEYQTRSIVLSQKITFRYGENDEQTLWLEVMQTMLLESFSLLGVNGKSSTSKNFEYLCGVLSRSDFLNRPVSGYGETNPRAPSELFCAVQLCLTDLALDLSMSYRCLRTDYDIKSVYSFEENLDHPFITTLDNLDLVKLLHIRNFWQRHLTNPDEATFYSSFAKLPERQRPKMRKNSLAGSSELGAFWLGYYSCIHFYPETPSSFEGRQTCADLDLSSHWTDVEPLSLRIKPDPNPMNWPLIFDAIIPILDSNNESKRTYFRGIQKIHGNNNNNNDDNPEHLIRGFTEPIPASQGGFPGWSRVCFVIYDPDRQFLQLIPSPSSSSEGEADEQTDHKKNEEQWFPQEDWPPFDLDWSFHWIYGYEGVLLPGGRIMMGRWQDMKSRIDTGPFIFWDL